MFGTDISRVLNYSYIIDQELWETVEKDTQRTRSEMHFFMNENTTLPKITNVFKKDKILT